MSISPDEELVTSYLDSDGDEVTLLPQTDWELSEENTSLPGRVSRMESESQSLRTFTKLYTFTQVLGIFSMVLMAIWLTAYRGGFAWHSYPQLEFNWHPMLMLVGMVFLSANSLLVYRGFRTERKTKLKLLHAGGQILSLLLATIGLVAVVDSHNLHVDDKGNSAPIPHFYSLHSWIGLAVFILFCLQWLFGLVSFLFPGLRQSLRDWYLPLHQFFGLAIFIGAIITALLGISEKAFFVMLKTYSQLPAEAYLVNMLGLILVLFAGLVIHLVTHGAYKRRATEEDLLLAAGAYME